jgi:3',5'-cyclic AMP phosphodiesterase CpdA
LAHISDPHLPPPAAAAPLHDLFSKRALSRFAWRRKRAQHDPAVLSAIMADIGAYAPDHLAITGDLMNFSTDGEAAAAVAWLSSLGSPSDITLSPGNHDALVGQGWSGRLSGFRPWLGDDDGGDFPYVRRRGPIAVISLRSALPTAPHLATGELGAGQLQRLDQALADLAAEGLFRVVLLHHPPTSGAVSHRKRLIDTPAFRAVVARRGAELVLHGHAHEALVGRIAGPSSRPVPVLGVPSASALAGFKHPAARWHAFEIEPDGAVTVIARGLDARTGRLGELGRYRLAA